MGAFCRNSDDWEYPGARDPLGLVDLNGQRLRLGMAGAVIDGKRVGSVFLRRDVDAIIVGRPDRAGLRLERDRLGVGYAVAKLGGFASADDARACIEHLDGKVFAAKLLDSDPVLFALFFGEFDGGALLDGAIFVPAGEYDPTNVDEHCADNQRGIDERILEEGFFWSVRFGEHPRISGGLDSS